jgi:RNA polymerase sigma-70 factor, ECF subfamily
MRAVMPPPSARRRERDGLCASVRSTPRGAELGAGWQPQASGAKASESALVEQLRSGDRPATERFVREHVGWMLALAQRYVKDASVAEDCVQEAFLQAFRGIGEFEGRSALRSWLYRIVSNTALMKLRSRRRAIEQPIEDTLAHIDRDCCRMGAPWAELATPHEILERKQARELVVAKMMELPDSYRIVLLLRDIEGMSTEETARALAMTEGAVKVRLHRARAAFKMLVEPVVRRYV